jgi:hypothetical protein
MNDYSFGTIMKIYKPHAGALYREIYVSAF